MLCYQSKTSQKQQTNNDIIYRIHWRNLRRMFGKHKQQQQKISVFQNKK